MRLYHFLNEQFGLESIDRRRLKVARINERNDPFEFSSVNFGDEAIRRAFGVMKQDLAARRGLLCFSSKWKNPVMWSHYAEKHRGLCLGFDVDDESIGEVSYSGKRLVVELEQLKSPKEFRPEEARKLLFTKYAHWSYENEFRAFVTLDEMDTDTGLYFARFSDKLNLKQVIVGAESSITREHLSATLGEELRQVETFKAKLAFRSFSVVRQRDAALWA
ncbi:MAG: hypothetical protein COW18_00380 [Zetaproteobacteria bacterium CG12_big_fil_rev_8_21_14_0_65_54_13]|nr:MAG: hypothetical protein COX55_05745 [Zetaproteobacteria bacterium CG23_combo_of_CG06-09_8_20_14_all_54_7]PIW51536.1 MAG: hypothetical protein COW18_00380 [Zetaproteobacteria bacterium CG12_big_fil_rev_8_21_14_0_65_54_13]PIX53614.1 MAG: hypothetical protein COZ50_12095 [Zetaproteobacteria bacterium CG_4_10_14_3_um_filter_54_28]PJA27928.1 MAG: hypothetical protein CO188_11265 [Zetaproteobacteria bacterium CG_4_9_14_3_um_filter_54_145]